jgi:hypothetical protein
VSELIARLHQTKRRPRLQIVCFQLLALQLTNGYRKKGKIANILVKIEHNHNFMVL